MFKVSSSVTEFCLHTSVLSQFLKEKWEYLFVCN